MSSVRCTRGVGKGGGYLLIALLASSVPARGQRYEITPLIGGAFGGTVKLERALVPNLDAHVADSFSFGVAGGVRFDGQFDGTDNQGYDAIEFRWMRQYTHLFFKLDPLVPIPTVAAVFQPKITLDHFLGDFTHEWNLEDAPRSIHPFLTVSVGAARMAAPASSATRFAFGIGTGVKVFPARQWGFRFKVEYLGIVMSTELQRLACVGGCVVVLNGGVMNQFVMSFGPGFRF
jgi:hypothetical protein